MNKQGNLQALLLEFYDKELRYYKSCYARDTRRKKYVKEALEAIGQLMRGREKDKVLWEIQVNLEKIAEAAAGNLEHSRNMKARYKEILNLAQQ